MFAINKNKCEKTIRDIRGRTNALSIKEIDLNGSIEEIFSTFSTALGITVIIAVSKEKALNNINNLRNLIL